MENSHIAPKSLTLIGNQGEIFNMEFRVLKARLCVIVTLKRQQNNIELLIAFLTFSRSARSQKQTQVFFSEIKFLPYLSTSTALSQEKKKKHLYLRVPENDKSYPGVENGRSKRLKGKPQGKV